ncbi:MAG: amidohydrolase [Chloroflexi bacterium]|nr:amidohydrolase [Chloroflexota bacterium]
MESLVSEANRLFETTRTIRRDLHRHPELQYKEARTAGVITNELNKLGLDVTGGVAKTGVVAILEGAQPGPTTLLRFDMDALPIQEETGAEYASQTPGVMHACGHDGHIAIGLTVARILSEHRSDLHGKIKLVFQPAEEGGNGAQEMMAAGILLDNPKPDHALALHLWNEKPVGWLGIVPGPLMAGADTFTIRIRGVGGHGALPQQSIDPVLASAQIITALQSIVSRNISPVETAVLSVTRFLAGETFNVIPSEAILNGTIRTFEKDVQKEVHHRMKQIVEGVAMAFGCKAEVEIETVTPPVVNDAETARRLQELARRDFSQVRLNTDIQTMVSEDMAFILQQVPGVYFLVGSANPEKGLNFGHHHPRFDFDEAALPLASAFMSAAAIELSKD